ncbi:DUF2256 domain-containing protein [Pseudomonas sp. PDM18]|uniref:DUF2256 domain-containing protein n=1 Tax=unclassified Pseudomonas TaxID=196821 RepID=UPI001785ABBA|nr:DUF2256 domain-containing protein [Pseudomonas sp. PDM18]MBD9676627.1 DUF2256 domain-containing protein [Pseudomonas sp. PDM18]
MKKTHLPEKTCLVCGRPFSWRRRWARCWDEVRYCSQRCRRSPAKREAQHQR